VSAMASFDVGLFSTQEEIDRLTAAIDLLRELDECSSIARTRIYLICVRMSMLRRLEEESWNA